MYRLKLFKRDVLVSGRYKRSFECLDNGIVYLIDYKNGMVDGSYKIYGSTISIWTGKLMRRDECFYESSIEYIKFDKNIMKLDCYNMIGVYYVNKIVAYFSSDNRVCNYITNKDKTTYADYEDVTYVISEKLYIIV